MTETALPETAELVLTGLDGVNPIGFLAALGVLEVLHGQHAPHPGAAARSEPKLSWRLYEGAWTPVLYWSDSQDRDALVEALMSDLTRWREAAPELELRYPHKGNAKKLVFELKPPPAQFQAFARSALKAACETGNRRWADYAAAFAAAHGEGAHAIAVDNNGQTKPTALHFCAGQQLFLQQVRTLRDGLEPDDFREALFGPWRYARELPVLNWDLTAGERDYALRAVNPSGDQKSGVPGADWLAFRALPFFPVVARQDQAATTGFEGSGKDFRMHWVLWRPPLTRSTVRSVIAADWSKVDADTRRKRGIVLALRSQVRRTDQGGYGSFAPPTIE